MTKRTYRLLFRAIVVICLIGATSIRVPAQASVSANTEGLFETGQAKKLETPIRVPDSIRIVSYNIRWRGGKDLLRLIELLRTDAEIGQATIVGLQEVDRDKKRTGNVNTARQMAEALGMYYAWAAPPTVKDKDKQPEEEETGVAILSAYPLTDATRFVLPNDGPGGRRRAAIGATVKIGERSIRVYSLHAEIRISNKERLEQFKAVIDDAKTNNAKIEHVVVLGDFNTITGKDVDHTTKLFTSEDFSTPFPNNLSTWKTFILQLKLDWLWLRGLKPTAFGIDKKVGLSDHWPLWAVVTLK